LAKVIPFPNEWMEGKDAAVAEACEDIDDVLVGLCFEEVEFLLDRIGATDSERLIVTMWCRGLSDAEITAGMSEYFPVSFGEVNVGAMTKRRQRIIYRMNKTAGKDLGLITVLHEAFKRNVH